LKFSLGKLSRFRDGLFVESNRFGQLSLLVGILPFLEKGNGVFRFGNILVLSFDRHRDRDGEDGPNCDGNGKPRRPRSPALRENIKRNRHF